MFFITMQILQFSSSCILTLSIILSWLILINPIILVSSECTCDLKEVKDHNKSTEAMKYKIGAIISILVAGAIGISLPLLGKKIPALRPEKDIFFLIKAFAAGVILATGFIHILPDAFNDLTSPCLKQNPWGDFPFTGFIAMMSAILTLMVDTLATGYYKRSHFNKSQPVDIGSDEEQPSGSINNDHSSVAHHHIHGHSHGTTMVSAEDSSTRNSVDLIRHRVTSQVLELGIVVHSVIVGITVGVSHNPSTIKPLFAALTFHQFFEGMGLGSCIAQAKLKSQAIFTMGLFFSFTPPIGIGIGIGISHVYNESSPVALIIQGTLNAAAAGILIYMSLVDLLAADFMSPKMQSNGKLQFASYVSLLLGSGFMSLLAKWF